MQVNNENSKELLEELRRINLKLKSIEDKLDQRTEGTSTTSYSFLEPVKWLLYGVFILGPAIAILVVIIPLLFHWLSSLFR